MRLIMFRKLGFLFFVLFSHLVLAQDVASIIRGHEDKSYNPKFKGLTDLVVDVENPALTNQLNEQMIFGNIRELKFRIYWTAAPERVAIEIIGMPEGFNEIKQQLKQTMLSKFEAIIPIALDKKFMGYKLSLDPKESKAIVAKDEKALNLIPEYKMSFNKDGLLSLVDGKKTIGTLTTSFDWEKTSWSEPRFINKSSLAKSVDGPQSVTVQSKTEWQLISSVGLPSRVVTTTRQVITIPGASPQENLIEEEINYKNYKVNVGEALKWFLANATN